MTHLCLIDITLPLNSDLPTYDGDPCIELHRIRYAIASDPSSYNLSCISMSGHAGTHVDAPVHFFSGASSVADLDLDDLCGPARVIDLRDQGPAIGLAQLKGLDLTGVRRVLLKTHSGEMFSKPLRSDHAYLSAEGADYLRSIVGVRLIGTDCLSIDAGDSDHFPAHHILLAEPKAVVVVEGLCLTSVDPGDYELWCLPIRLSDADGAPARVVLTQK